MSLGGITITFGDRAENHAGMQIIGESAVRGYSLEDLLAVKAQFPENQTELVCMHAADARLPEAYLLIVRGAVDNAKELYDELSVLAWDTKFFSKKHIHCVDKNTGEPTHGVVNKLARDNLCFDDVAQDPDYKNKKGTVIALNTVPLLNQVKENVMRVLSEEKDLKLEGNFYENVTKNGIGFHGDGERKKTVGLRLGASHDLVFQWFIKETNTNKLKDKAQVVQIGEPIRVQLNAGDLYMMTEKTTGTDWKKRKIPTLRHAAGAAKYLTTKHVKRKFDDML